MGVSYSYVVSGRKSGLTDLTATDAVSEVAWHTVPGPVRAVPACGIRYMQGRQSASEGEDPPLSVGCEVGYIELIELTISLGNELRGAPLLCFPSHNFFCSRPRCALGCSLCA